MVHEWENLEKAKINKESTAFKFRVWKFFYWTQIHPVRCLLSNRVNTDFQDIKWGKNICE
jgi:hypothetical protein